MKSINKTYARLILQAALAFFLTMTVQAGENGWINMFNGKDLAGWHLTKPGGPNGWTVERGVYVNTPPSTDLATNRDYYNFELHVEFNVAPESNSGIYMRDRYEIQIFDSFGKPVTNHDCGALYRRVAPGVNASKPAGEWQSFDITFVGKRLKVKQNGVEILDVADVGPRGTGAASERADAPGPLRLQGDHGKVLFRNLRIRPLP